MIEPPTRFDRAQLNLTPFHAFRIRNGTADYRSGVDTTSLDKLSPGEIVVKNAYSSANNKDARAGQGKILRSFPLIVGIGRACRVLARPRVQGWRCRAGHRLRLERNPRRRLQRIRVDRSAMGGPAQIETV